MAESLIVNDRWVAENPALKPFPYLAQSRGAYRGLQVGQKTTKIAIESMKMAGQEVPETLRALDKNLGTGAGALGFIRLPHTTSEALKSMKAFEKSEAEDGVSFYRKAAHCARDTCDAIANLGYVTTFIKFDPTVKRIADTADLITDSTSLGLDGTDYRKASALESQATGLAKQALSHSKQYYFLSMVKNITGIAAAILGLVLVYTATPLIPLIALLTLSLLSTIFAIKRDLHENEGPYPLIKFDRDVKTA